MESVSVRLSVGDFIAATNQTLEYAYPAVEVIGEAQGFKVNQNKYVFFDLKDDEASVGCFMTVWQLRTPLEDGMKVVVNAQPKLTKWGKFSLTVKQITPVGEGSIKRSFTMLVAKLQKEGLFEEDRKRPLPVLPFRIGVIASMQSAGYADFIEILNERWGGLEIEVAHVQVQGMDAPNQIIKALAHFNQAQNPPEVIALMRGGGSLDDLGAFNDEPLVRAIAGSRVPVITGIGHETDTSLTDMAADYRAATPSNAAQKLVPDKREIKAALAHRLQTGLVSVSRAATEQKTALENALQRIFHQLEAKEQTTADKLKTLHFALQQLNPEAVLKRGYSITRMSDGRLAHEKMKPGDRLSIELKNAIINAGVTNVSPKDR